MLDNEQIYKHIPRPISQWSVVDVNSWFRINDIQLQREIDVDGRGFVKLTASKLLGECGLSMFLTRKIVDWIEFESEGFDEFVGEMAEGKGSLCGLERKQQAANQSQLVINNQVNSNSSQSGSDNQPQCKNNNGGFLSSSNSSEPSDLSYKPIKYKKWRQSNPPENDLIDKHSQSVRQCPVIRKKQFVTKKEIRIDDFFGAVVGNGEDVETCKNIPEGEDDDERLGLKKVSSENYLFKEPQSNNELIKKSMQISPSKTNEVKFVTSQIVIANGSLLTVLYEDNFFHVTKNTKIGRSTYNDIVLKAEGVSRNHAEVLIEDEIDFRGCIFKKYYLRDIGSKYGTFVETDPEKPKKVIQGDQYCIGQTTVRIERLKVSKSKQKFDLSLSIIQATEEQRQYQNRSLIMIGNRKKQSQNKEQKSSQITKRTGGKEKRDLEFDDNSVKNYHCRFVIINGEVYLEQVEGNILEKIQKNVKYPLNKPQCQVKFGDGSVMFRLEQGFKPLCQSTD